MEPKPRNSTLTKILGAKVVSELEDADPREAVKDMRGRNCLAHARRGVQDRTNCEFQLCLPYPNRVRTQRKDEHAFW